MTKLNKWITTGQSVPVTAGSLHVVSSSGTGATWHPTHETRQLAPGGQSLEIAQATPSNAVLLDWASKSSNQPPQSWWDETVNPFESEQDE